MRFTQMVAALLGVVVATDQSVSPRRAPAVVETPVNQALISSFSVLKAEPVAVAGPDRTRATVRAAREGTEAPLTGNLRFWGALLLRLLRSGRAPLVKLLRVPLA